MWDSYEDIVVEGVFLSCILKIDESCEDIIIWGVRYYIFFLLEFLYFEVRWNVSYDYENLKINLN